MDGWSGVSWAGRNPQVQDHEDYRVSREWAAKSAHMSSHERRPRSAEDRLCHDRLKGKKKESNQLKLGCDSQFHVICSPKIYTREKI